MEATLSSTNNVLGVFFGQTIIVPEIKYYYEHMISKKHHFYCSPSRYYEKLSYHEQKKVEADCIITPIFDGSLKKIFKVYLQKKYSLGYVALIHIMKFEQILLFLKIGKPIFHTKQTMKNLQL